jgi:exopolyphosphatase/guanosine-5'-triphosphate,3'-diphosphate pyrophosphatase
MGSVAAIDIGSNSVRLLIVDESGAEVCREMNITRLAEGVDQNAALSEAAMARTLQVLDTYGALIQKHGANRVRVTGTSAARDARNRDDFFLRVERSVGSAPELLSGGAEAALAFAGATADRQSAEGPFVTLDIGCVRISERFLASDPPAPAELGAAITFIRGLLERVDREVPVRGAHTWLGMAGTVTSLAARDAGLVRYDPNVTHGYRLRRDKVEALHADLAAQPAAERAKLLLEPKRAGVILGGSVVLIEVMRFFDLESIIVSERDILDGLAASLRPAREGHA